MRRRSLRTGLGFLFVLLSGVCGVSMAVAAEPYRIGAVLEVTGGASFLGEPGRNGIKMLEEQVNAGGGINGRPIEMVIYDTVG